MHGHCSSKILPEQSTQQIEKTNVPIYTLWPKTRKSTPRTRHASSNSSVLSLRGPNGSIIIPIYTALVHVCTKQSSTRLKNAYILSIFNICPGSYRRKPLMNPHCTYAPAHRSLCMYMHARVFDGYYTDR